MLEQLVVADDLSGAAESAATFLLRTTRIAVLLAAEPVASGDSSSESPRVVVVDTDSRHLVAAAAGDAVSRRVAQAIAGVDGVRVVKKVDSLLRGNLAAEVRALASLLGATPVVATALPSAGRTVVGGVPLVDGHPLASTTLWAAEDGQAPRTVAAALTGMDSVTVPLAVVRDGAQLRAVLAASAEQGRVPVCDAETDADLDAVVAAANALPDTLLVGSAALVAADARGFPADPAPSDPASSDPASSHPMQSRTASDHPLTTAPGSRTERDHLVVAVIGSAAPSVAAQVALLEQLGLPVLRLDPRELLESPTGARRRVEEGVAGAGLVIALDQTVAVEPAQARRLSAALASATEPATSRATVLLATGGETARAVLGSLHVNRLTPVTGHEGVVRSLTPEGLVVLTRPGSHGPVTSLHDALAPFVPAPDRTA
jgi:4-hydroxythreonine-4-phosphate dehydrogenase